MINSTDIVFNLLTFEIFYKQTHLHNWWSTCLFWVHKLYSGFRGCPPSTCFRCGILTLIHSNPHLEHRLLGHFA